MKRLSKDDRAGLYITVIFHLAVIIVFLLVQIGVVVRKSNAFMLDFSAQEKFEKLKKELALKEEVSRRLEEMLGGESALRNVAVDASKRPLKDDRGTNAEELYRDAEKLQKDIASQPEIEDEDFGARAMERPEPEKHKQESDYKGPSVLSYNLDGRKASHLPIPAYRCMGSGTVTVIIGVDNAGNVVRAQVQEDRSSDNACLRDFAIRAARMSKFTASPTAPARQGGSIIYEFIAQ